MLCQLSYASARVTASFRRGDRPMQPKFSRPATCNHLEKDSSCLRRKKPAIVRRAGRALPRLLCPGEGKCGADFFARKPREQHLLRVILLRNRSVDERDLGSHGDDPAVGARSEERGDGE